MATVARLVAFIVLTTAEIASADTILAFEGTVSGQQVAVVLQAQSAWDGPYVPDDFRNTESPISSLSDWAFFDDISLPPGFLADNSYRQQLLILDDTSQGSHFRYFEFIDGNSASGHWSHTIDIREADGLDVPLLFGGLVGVADYFEYVEVLAVPGQPTRRASGFLTLVSVEHDPLGAAVPEPGGAFLVCLGIAAAFARHRRKGRETM